MPLPPHLLDRIPPLPVDRNPSAPPIPPSLADSFRAATAITRHHAKSFYFASHFLRPRKRREAYAVYAYCRYIDDRIDEHDTHNPPPSQEELTAENHAFLAGDHPAGFAPSFAWTCSERQIPLVLLEELVEGCSRDRGTVRIQTAAELEEYCYLVASVVGLMMCRVFGVSSVEAYPRAVEMGLAMQITNILRDIREDYERGRIYLPAEERAARGLDMESLLQNGPDEGWKEYLATWIRKARSWYRSAETGLPYLQNRTCARTARIMGRVYGGILDEIERADYDIRTRHYVPLRRKFLLAFLKGSTSVSPNPNP